MNVTNRPTDRADSVPQGFVHVVSSRGRRRAAGAWHRVLVSSNEGRRLALWGPGAELQPVALGSRSSAPFALDTGAQITTSSRRPLTLMASIR